MADTTMTPGPFLLTGSPTADCAAAVLPIVCWRISRFHHQMPRPPARAWVLCPVRVMAHCQARMARFLPCRVGQDLQ